MIRKDRSAIDAWTLVHFGAGYLIGMTNWSRPIAYAAIAIYEAIEPHVWPGWRESPRNVGMDFVSSALGFEVSRKFGAGKARGPEGVLPLRVQHSGPAPATPSQITTVTF